MTDQEKLQKVLEYCDLGLKEQEKRLLLRRSQDPVMDLALRLVYTEIIAVIKGVEDE